MAGSQPSPLPMESFACPVVSRAHGHCMACSTQGADATRSLARRSLPRGYHMPRQREFAQAAGGACGPRGRLDSRELAVHWRTLQDAVRANNPTCSFWPRASYPVPAWSLPHELLRLGYCQLVLLGIPLGCWSPSKSTPFTLQELPRARQTSTHTGCLTSNTTCLRAKTDEDKATMCPAILSST